MLLQKARTALLLFSSMKFQERFHVRSFLKVAFYFCGGHDDSVMASLVSMIQVYQWSPRPTKLVIEPPALCSLYPTCEFAFSFHVRALRTDKRAAKHRWAVEGAALATLGSVLRGVGGDVVSGNIILGFGDGSDLVADGTVSMVSGVLGDNEDGASDASGGSGVGIIVGKSS